VQEATVEAVIARGLDAYPSLAALGEGVEDEWQYVADLSAAWIARLRAVAAAREGEPAPAGASAAVAAVADEIGLITDPHRAIDWLSTFPQVVLAAVGETG
jgi:hypothetical protein